MARRTVNLEAARAYLKTKNIVVEENMPVVAQEAPAKATEVAKAVIVGEFTRMRRMALGGAAIAIGIMMVNGMIDLLVKIF